MQPALALALAFLVGSTPTALLLGKLRGIDVRKHGSGNVGATNALRVLGKACGAICLAVDVLKGFGPALLFAGGAWRPDALGRETWMALVGVAAVAGHAFSPWIGFKGGKGVATSLGAFLAVAPVAVLVCVAVGVAIILTTGYVSAASMVGSALLPIAIALTPREGERPWPAIGLAAALAAFVVWKHRTNLRRLLDGTEANLRDAAPEKK